MALIAADFFLYAASGLVAPWWVVIVMVVVWVGLFVVAASWWTPHPTWLTPLALAGTLLWFAVLVSGAVYLGWSA